MYKESILARDRELQRHRHNGVGFNKSISPRGLSNSKLINGESPPLNEQKLKFTKITSSNSFNSNEQFIAKHEAANVYEVIHLEGNKKVQIMIKRRPLVR